MTIAQPNPDVEPTGEEPAEFVEPQPQRRVDPEPPPPPDDAGTGRDRAGAARR